MVLCQQQSDDVGVSVLAGAHERRGALVILQVDVGPSVQQSPHHVRPAVTHSQHQSRLTGLHTDHGVRQETVLMMQSWHMSDISNMESQLGGGTIELTRNEYYMSFYVVLNCS